MNKFKLIFEDEELNYLLEAVDRLRKVTGQNIANRILTKITNIKEYSGLKKIYGVK